MKTEKEIHKKMRIFKNMEAEASDIRDRYTNKEVYAMLIGQLQWILSEE